jgi:hypothetical protein
MGLSLGDGPSQCAIAARLGSATARSHSRIDAPGAKSHPPERFARIARTLDLEEDSSLGRLVDAPSPLSGSGTLIGR